jgi:hypothetical protein
MKIPDFWKGSLEDIESTLKTIRKGKVGAALQVCRKPECIFGGIW